MHNIILILVPSKWLILYSWGSSNSWFEMLYLFFSRSSKFSQLFHREDPSNHCKDSPCVFNFSFLSFDHSFITGVLHGGSTWWFIKDLIPSRSVHQDSFLRSSSFSSSCHPECNSFYRIIGGGIMSFLIIWVHVSRFTHY